MNYDSIMIHFGELSTKGNNRNNFVQRLTHNVRLALSRFPLVTCKGTRDHIYVYLNGESPDKVVARLSEVAGIQKMSLVRKVEPEENAIKEAALELVKGEVGKAFKVNVKRIDKTFPIRSYDLTVAIADYILENTNLSVDLHAYDFKLSVIIREDGVFLSCHEYLGLGGYPLGMNGKVIHLLSGGIDSPVAAYKLLRRGIEITCLHFASPPYTQAAVIDKLKDILGALGDYQPSFKLIVVPFTKLQLAIYENVPEPYCITIMRRMMLRIASRVAEKEKSMALSTGESIGQVASQTLESMNVINAVTNTPIIRPLAAEDKVEIVNIAKRIKTYDVSIRPYEDCCTIFKPKKPKTKPKLKDCLYYESKFDYESLIEEALNNLESMRIVGGEEVKPQIEKAA